MFFSITFLIALPNRAQNHSLCFSPNLFLFNLLLTAPTNNVRFWNFQPKKEFLIFWCPKEYKEDL